MVRVCHQCGLNTWEHKVVVEACTNHPGEYVCFSCFMDEEVGNI